MGLVPPKKLPKLTALSRQFTNVEVWLGPKNGSAPTAEDRSDYLSVQRIERVGSGQRINVATLNYDLGKDQEHILDTLTPKSINRQIEIREIDMFGETKRILFWGKLAAQPVTIDDKEVVQYIARIDKHHYGDPLGKVPFWTPNTGGAFLELDRPLWFNPEIDDIVTANKSNKLWADRDNCFVFFDSAAINTAAARATHDQVPAKWLLYEAVHTLCWLCNPDQTWITNPSLAELTAQLAHIDVDHERLKNVHLESNKYLPQLLDELLDPLGCSWTLDIEEDSESGETVRRIRCFERNNGTQRELYLQRPGQPVDPVLSTAAKISTQFDIATLANKIIGCSSRKQREGTFELKKGWKVSEDGTDKEAFEQSSTSAHDKPHAIRKWIYNESGAWAGLRPEITFFTDLTSLFGGDPTLPTCRKFLPCISRVTDEATDKLESRGYLVEWLDPADSIWKKVKWSYSVLQLELGIWFESFPQELWDALQDDPATARVRITATIEGDTKLYATAERQSSSPNADDITLRLNLGNKFHDRGVHSSSVFIADIASADVTNDQIPLQAYVAAVRGVEDSAELSCSVTLEGWDHPEYQIGDLVTRVAGRNISLVRNNKSLGVTERYLQIMGITYNVGEKGQTMELLLESFDEEQPL